MSNVRDLFTSGQISKVYKSFQKNHFQESDFTWILGSLCLLGKIDEAKQLIKERVLESEHYFFLALSFIRISDFETAKFYIDKLKKLPHKKKFFIYQSMAIYAYYKSRYRACLKIVKRSRAESLTLENAFWKVLAIDLLGHTHVMMGEVHKGISLLEEAHDLALTINNKAFLEATKISILNYQSQYTDEPQALISKIERKLKSIARQDNYSEGSLTLSLTHLYILTGSMERAKKTLLLSQKIIFAAANPRQKCKWFFEKSYFHYLEGKFDLSLDFLNEAINLINPTYEINLGLKILGLKRNIYSKLKKNTKEIDIKLIELTLKSGDPQALNKLSRIGLMPKEHSEDPLQAIFDEYYFDKNFTNAIELGFYGIIRQKLIDQNETLEQNYYNTELWKSSLLIVTPKLIFVKKSGVSSLLANALKTLALKKNISKEDLVQKIWGYNYDPIRHDTLLYGLIHRLRKILGPLENSLIGENNQYYFTHSFKYLDLKVNSNISQKEITQSNELLQDSFQNSSNWNIRQHRVLSLMARGQSFKVSEYAKTFNVSTMTALRDLTELKDKNLVKIYGKARATTYAF
jgi:predicted DNA-binding transcriptional regulator